jgi:hypothetical protein
LVGGCAIRAGGGGLVIQWQRQEHRARERLDRGGVGAHERTTSVSQGSSSSIRRSCCPAVTISGVWFKKAVIKLPLALPSAVAVCAFTQRRVPARLGGAVRYRDDRRLLQSEHEAEVVREILRNVSSVDPGLPNTVVSPITRGGDGWGPAEWAGPSRESQRGRRGAQGWTYWRGT